MTLLPFLTVLVAAGGGLLILSYSAPLQVPTVVFYAGLAIGICGLVSLVRPLRWMAITTRRFAAAAACGGVVLAAGALVWPVQTQQSSSKNPLDTFLPAYDFHEYHDVRVHAGPDRVAAAIREVTFADIGVMRTLMRVRNAALGVPRELPPAQKNSMLQLISEGRTGFFPLLDTEREFIFGIAGQPWNNAARPVRLTPQTFRTWAEPGKIRVAANLRVDDAGGGWSLLSSETRVQANDDEARRTMARYWRIIYPGSGLIRRSLLNSIKERAER